MHRLSAGSYSATVGAWTYYVQAVRSAYGDVQWVIDREHTGGRVQPTWGQTDTLRDARKAIAATKEG